MSNDSIFSKKLSAFLHDPIDKPFVLMQGESHEERAAYLADLMQVSIEKSEGSDWIASAMERVLLPEESSRNKKLQIKFLDAPEIKHPLSGKNLECGELKDCQLDAIKETVEKSAREFAVDGHEKQFLNLWRNYIETIKKNSSPEIKKYWSVIPADTRMPDHSIFEHLRITSACYNAMADKENKMLRHNLSFFLCSIGPVQSFIATARKLQDLWMGSFILSYLTWAGIKVVVQKYGPDAVIFPDLYKQPLVDHWLKNEKGIEPLDSMENHVTLPSFPNRFLAIVPNDSVTELGETVEQEIRKTFITKSLDAIHNLKNNSKGKLFDFTIDETQLCEHLSKFMDVYWVAVPWPQSFEGKSDWQTALGTFSDYLNSKNVDNAKKALQFFSEKGEYPPNIGTVYELLYAFTEKALGSRKSIRNFDQIREDGQKCSLCGERRAFKKESKCIRDYKKGLMGEKEFLCGVCLTKRLGKYAFADIFKNIETEFPSIAEVAVSDFKLNFLQNRPEAFANYVEKCRSLFGKDFAHKTDLLEKVKAQTSYDGDNIGGEFFIQDFLTEKNLKKALELDADKHLPDGKAEELEYLQKELQKNTGSDFAPSSYYAVIMMDGDDMGKWLKGEIAPTVDQIFHSRVWKNLPSKYQEDLRLVFDEGKRPMSPAIHSAISAALRDYSLSFAKRIVEDAYLGKLIYAGGDDVLAIVNLRDLLSVMKKLRAAFSGHIDGDLQVNFKANVSGFVDTGYNLLVTMGPKATASMGVAIAHYKMPFSMVLDKARKMEKKAKKVDGKNSFAIALMKHSGGMRECAAKWDYEEIDKPGGTIELIEILTKLIRCDDLSNKFIYSLRDEFLRLFDKNGTININSGIIKEEIKRLILRAKKKKADKRENDKFKKELGAIAEDFYELFMKMDGHLKSFLTLLETANFLAREVNEVK